MNSYAKISDSLLDIFNATEIGTATTLRDDDLLTSTGTPFETYNRINIANDMDYLDEDDDPAEQRQFHRISGILSQLIREANNAINSTPSSLPAKHTTMNENGGNNPMMKKGMDSKSLLHTTDRSAIIMERNVSTTSTSDTSETDNASLISTIIDAVDNNDTSPQQFSNTDDISAAIKDSRRRSRLPRPKKLSLESFAQFYPDRQHQHYLQRDRSSSNASSTVSSTTSTPNLDEDNTLFSPIASSLTTPMSRTISPLFLEKEHYSQQSHHRSNTNDCILHVENQQSKDSKGKHRSQPDGTLSLTDSFERLDSSLAKVDTLSRDLANYRRKHPRSSKNLPDTAAAAQPAPVPPSAPTFMSSDNNIAANHHHHQHSNGWAVLLLVLPLFYIPYLLILALWEKWDMAASVATTTPLDLLSMTISTLMFGGDSKVPRAFISSSTTATQIIPLSVGLSVYTLFMVILRLLMTSKPSSST